MLEPKFQVIRDGARALEIYARAHTEPQTAAAWLRLGLTIVAGIALGMLIAAIVPA
jgi:hypothetical protein